MPRYPKGWQVWAIWLASFIASFLALERKTLRDAHAHREGGPEPKIDPLSTFLRFLLQVRKEEEAGLGKEAINHLGLIAFGCFWVWLIVHLAAGPLGSNKADRSELN